MRKDGRTDRHDEANSRFKQFCEKRVSVFKYIIPKATRYSKTLISGNYPLKGGKY